MRKLYIFGLVGLACAIIGLAWAEQLTMTTYYPAPYGVYKEFTTTSKTSLATGDTAVDTTAQVIIGTINTGNPGDNKLTILGGTTHTAGGLIIETRTTDPAASNLVAGRMWLRQ